MAQFLATVYSSSNKRGGIGIIDSNRGLIYIQSDELPERVHLHQMRGIQYQNERVYITTPASIRIYSVRPDVVLPYFCLENEIILPEWVLGSKFQADLLGVLIPSKRRELFVANNNFNSIDELRLDGTLIKRHFLSDISPAFFSNPEMIHGSRRFGHIRSLSEAPDGSIWITIHGVNGSDFGCIVNFDTGEVLLDNLYRPHGLSFSRNHMFVQEAGAQGLNVAKISAYCLDRNGKPVSKLFWAEELDFREASVDQLSRGLVHSNDVLYYGVYCSGAVKGAERIIPFDARTGKAHTKTISLCGCQGFDNPQVFFLSEMPDNLEIPESYEPTIFVDGIRHQWSPQVMENVKVKDKAVRNIFGDLDVPVITLNNVSLDYRRLALSSFSFRASHRKSKLFRALNRVSFTIYEGETVGIIGRNGSGKSSVSKVISRALPVDEGTLTVCGHVQLLSIGLGFQPRLTGRDNVFINGALLGLSRDTLREKMTDIQEFSEIGEFLDEPVRTYSAGMRSRLGFSIATVVRPDILILDEVMSTGDAAFRKKADERMLLMRKDTKTVILIAHNVSKIRKMCSRVIWLDKGELIMNDSPEVVLPRYKEFCYDAK